jgi:glycosyltransferase involved in cell wall biosynthesis
MLYPCMRHDSRFVESRARVAGDQVISTPIAGEHLIMASAPSPTGVLLLARHLDLGGTERQLCETARSLDRREFDVHVGCFRPGGIRAREIAADKIPIVELPLSSFKSPASVSAAVRALREYVRAHRLSVVHAFDPPAVLFAGLAAPFISPAAVLSSQRCFRQMCSPWFRRGLYLADRWADGVVVNCEALRRFRLQQAPGPEARLHLCYNGLDIDRFQRQPSSAVAGLLPPGALVIGSVCGLRPEKSLPVLVDAFAACAARHPNLFLLLVGDGSERDRLDAQARDLGIASRCLFEPMAADVVPWLSAIDIFVLPSGVNEALSNSLMEALACGCACVASRVGGNPELIADGETGLLFDPNRVDQLAAQLTRLVQDEVLRRRLATNGTRSIRARFSLQASARRMGAIYHDVLAMRKQAG